MKNKLNEIYVRGSFDSSYFFREGERTGNSTEYCLKIDGNQWGNTKFKLNDDGFDLTFYGEWEAIEFLRAMAQSFFLSNEDCTKEDLMSDLSAHKETVELKRTDFKTGIYAKGVSKYELFNN